MRRSGTSAPGRVAEITLAASLLPALAIATVTLWILGRLHGHCGLFFRQDRVGQAGRRIRILKFRTMWGTDREAGCEVAYRIVRRVGLDELPQILLVLTGGMALIGPRPLLMRDLFPPDVSIDRRLWAAIRSRQSLRPGITGVAQLLDRRRVRRGTSYWRMLDADVWYVQQRSVSLNLYLVLLTPLYALTGGLLRFPTHVLMRGCNWSFSRQPVGSTLLHTRPRWTSSNPTAS